jgi:hypothetical protein
MELLIKENSMADYVERAPRDTVVVDRDDRAERSNTGVIVAVIIVALLLLLLMFGGRMFGGGGGGGGTDINVTPTSPTPTVSP